MFMPIMPDDKIGAAVLAGNFGAIGNLDSKTSGKNEAEDKDYNNSKSASSVTLVRK
jgi:hypothetical protein